MKDLFFFCCLSILACKSPNRSTATPGEQPQASYLDETEYYLFYSPYWLNMHHFLHHKVLHRDTTQTLVLEKEIQENLSPDQKETTDEVVAYYQENLIKQDLRSSDYMAEFKHWVVQQSEQGFTEIPDSFRQHVSLLQAFDPIYRKHYWQNHYSGSKRILNQHLDLIRKTEKETVSHLSKWSGTEWQKEKIRVDITHYAKSYPGYERDRPFTTLYPTHVVMNVRGHSTPGNWIELLYHESSHHLIFPSSGFVSETLGAAAKELGQKVPRDLWHAYLFYFSGKISQELLQANGIENYELYMFRNRVFRYYHTYLEEFLPPYLAGKEELFIASKKLLKAYYDDRK